MSADNWTVCPKCCKQENEEFERLKEEADDCYGKVSKERYLKLVEQTKYSPEPPITLREDWELGISKFGGFVVSYKAHCDRCGLKFKYDYSESLQI